jgi:hypothetical protein
MSTTDLSPPAGWRDPDRRCDTWLVRAESWLDARGKAAWIAAAVIGFILFWPIGLGLLAYMIWSKRMFSSSKSCNRGWSRDDSRARVHAARAAMRPSGNSAFDAYKAETLRRLEEEQRAFEDFLGRLRAARDKAEFDQFMEERARSAGRPASEGGAA